MPARARPVRPSCGERRGRLIRSSARRLLRLDAPVTFVQQSDEDEPVRELCWFHSCFSGTEKAEGSTDQTGAEPSSSVPRQPLKKNHASMGATSTDGYRVAI